ncbi:hypothetical protein BBD39_06135 [Arsenophonus endosymbiont of Bemisia tabaci Asia II 3]|nr:hypothetical protein BBD39_06135 [Arsenophonus endosymbiont of Bemisia tabaci Asia II 3]
MSPQQGESYTPVSRPRPYTKAVTATSPLGQFGNQPPPGSWHGSTPSGVQPGIGGFSMAPQSAGGFAGSQSAGGFMGQAPQGQAPFGRGFGGGYQG